MSSSFGRLSLGLLLLSCFSYSSCSAEVVEPEVTLSGCARLDLPPVLFVHGSGLSSATWFAMHRHLRESGYPPEYLLAIDLEPNDGDNIEAAEVAIPGGVGRLLEAASVAVAESDCGTAAPAKVVLVAHSMGAISSRWYAATVEPERVLALIALAGANHGTNSLCALSGVGDAQMCPAFASDAQLNRLQVALNGTRENPLDETPYGLADDPPDVDRVPPDEHRRIIYLTLFLEVDEWITPSDSAMLAGAGGVAAEAAARLPLRLIKPGNYRFEGRTSHDDLPSHPDTLHFVRRVLHSLPSSEATSPEPAAN